MKPKLHLHLFGTPQFTYQGEPLTGFVSNKARALLIYLAVTGRAHSRAAPAELLWADTTPSLRRASLRKALSKLRQLLGVILLEPAAGTVVLDRASYWLDVGAFAQVAGNESATIRKREERMKGIAIVIPQRYGCRGMTIANLLNLIFYKTVHG